MRCAGSVAVGSRSRATGSGWQIDTFAPRPAKFIRLTGLTNSTGQPLLQVVEFEAYDR
ncbi:MAG: hypothetical protein NTZ09_00535 [Candidatus Hydrogenedentes bacterium]|nr:hypothetical protein [Candidatus Hydrogenedentota bacterium]